MFGVSSLPRTLEAARRDLNHARRHVRLSVARDLGLLTHAPETRAQAVALLSAMSANDQEPLVRGAATLALADCPGDDALAALLLASGDDHLYVSEAALIGLREAAPRGHREASRVITRRFRDQHAALRFQAVLAASRVLQDDEFVPLALEAAGDGDPKVRYVLWRVCDERFAGVLPHALHQALEMALNDSDPYVPIAAAFVLGPNDHTKARQVLGRAINARLKLPAPEDEQTLVELIGELGVTEGIPGLRAHARGRFGLVPGRFAWQAQIALARLGDDWAIRQLSRNLKHRSTDVRIHAATAVGAARLTQLRPLIENLGRTRRIPSELAASVLSELETATGRVRKQSALDANAPNT
jgi:HEAT repeat protein